MRPLLALLLWCLPLAAAAEPAGPVDVAIVVSLDRSESIYAEDATAQIDGLVYTLRHSRFRDTVGAGRHGRIALSVLTWSSFARKQVILPWTRIAGRADAEAAAVILERDHDRQRIARHGSQTDVAFAICPCRCARSRGPSSVAPSGRRGCCALANRSPSEVEQCLLLLAVGAV